MRPTDREKSGDVSLFELWMGMTPEEWDALPAEQDADEDFEDR